MRTTPFILGFEQIISDSPIQISKDEEEDGQELLQYRLAEASDVVIIDDTTSLNDFREYILSCPQDDLIEAFVEQLGARRISKLVNTNFTSTPVPEASSPRANTLRKLVMEVSQCCHVLPHVSY